MMASSRSHPHSGYVPRLARKHLGSLTIRIWQGKYLGTLQDVNHLDLVGWVNTARYKWAELMGKEITRFKPASFYLEVTSKLAEEVEGLRMGDENSASNNEPEIGEEDDRDGLKSAHSKQKTRGDVDSTGLPAPPGTVGGGVD